MSLRRLNRRQFAVALESEESRAAAPAAPASEPEVPAAPDTTMTPDATQATAAPEVPAAPETTPAPDVTEANAEPAPAAAAPAEPAATPEADPALDPATPEATGDAPATVEPAAAAPETSAPPAEAPTFSAAELVRRAMVRAEGGDPDAAPPADPAAPAEPAAAAPAAAEVPTAPAEPELPAIAEEDLDTIDSEGDAADAFLNEAGEEEERVDELEGEVQQAEGAHRRLNNVADIVETAAENGGLSDDGAQLLDIAVESIYASLGMDKPIGMPALESFTTVASKVNGAKIALETIKETAANVWKKIVEAFKKAVEWMNAFFQKVFTANGRLKARAEKILETAKQVGIRQPAQMEVGNEHLAKAMTINGQLVRNPSQFMKQANSFAAAAFGPKIVESLKLIGEGLSAADAAAKAGEADKNSKLVEVSHLFGGAVKLIVSVGLKDYHGSGADFGVEEPADGMKLVTSPVFLGDKMIWAQVPATDSGDDAMFQLSHFKTGLSELRGKAEKGTNLKTLPASEIAKMAEAALEFVSISEKYKSIQTEVNAAYKRVAQVAGSVSAGEGHAVKQFISAFRISRALLKGIHQPAMALGASTASIGLEYAALSLRAYGGASTATDTKGLPAPAAAAA